MQSVPEQMVEEGAPLASAARTIRWLTWGSLFVALAMFVTGATVLVQDRQEAWRRAELSATNLVMALEHDISRQVAIYDLTLRGIADARNLPGIDQASAAVRHAAMFDRSAAAEDLGSALLIGPDGWEVADSGSVAPRRIELADRDYFVVHRDAPDVGLFVSRPFRSRFSDGVPSIGFSRRLSGPDGSFQGVVEIALRLSYFEKLFSRLDLGANATVALTRFDGRVIYREPFHAEDVDRDITASANFQKFMREKSGLSVARSSFDGVLRLFAYRQIDGLPLVLAVAFSVEEIYAPWWRKAALIGGILALLSFAMAALTLLFRRELLRRLAADVIAATDGLTGLTNRRSFDTEFDKEWRRAMRCGRPIALLMLDVDLFKLYNDRYGHQAGDFVLKSIAGAMRGCIHRPGDLAARYGGEEFVVVLPETTSDGARVIAERIRAAIAARAIPHADCPAGHVTISIGIAAAIASPKLAESRLLKRADEALYAAKRGGRDQVVVADEAGTAPPANRQETDAEHAA